MTPYIRYILSALSYVERGCMPCLSLISLQFILYCTGQKMPHICHFFRMHALDGLPICKDYRRQQKSIVRFCAKWKEGNMTLTEQYSVEMEVLW